jgi:phosphoglycerate dehydrogenase-like enzyme
VRGITVKEEEMYEALKERHIKITVINKTKKKLQ